MRRNPDGAPTSEAASVMDALLLMEREFAQIQNYIGEPHVLALEGFKQGYQLCLLRSEGRGDERYARFREWLREVKKELPLEGWYTRNLADSAGNHLHAMRRWLDRAAEFHSLGEPEPPPQGIPITQEAPAPEPYTPPGTDSVLDALLLLGREFSRVLMYIGQPSVVALNGFILGYQYCLGSRGRVDERYGLFQRWLREAKHALPPEGWQVGYLEGCGGDHLQAIRKLLNLASEYHASAERQG
jgi:hypothetical protein